MVEPITRAKHRPTSSGDDPFNKDVSVSSTYSTSGLLYSAPTPHNTHSSPEDYITALRGDSDQDVFYKEMRYESSEGDDLSIRPSIGPTSSRPGLTSTIPSSLSSHASSYLLPTPCSSSSDDPMSTPRSSRPVPNPPLSLSSSSTIISSDPIPMSDSSSVSRFEHATSTFEGVKLSDGSDLEASSSRGLRGMGMKQEDIDAHRLQQLGYDAVLGRDYTFWSSLSISWLNIGCLQVG